MNLKNFARKIDLHFVALLLCVLAAAVMFFEPSIRGNDGVQNVAYLQSLLFDGDLNFTNEYQQYYYLEPAWFNNVFPPSDPVTGRPINLYGVGSSLLWSPLFSLSYLMWWCIEPQNLPASGTFVYRYSVGLHSLGYAIAGLSILFFMLKRRFSPMAALLTCIMIWFATPLFFYANAHGSMSHANSFFVATVLLAICFQPDSTRRWIMLGAAGALVVLVRFQDAALLSIPIGAELLRINDERKSNPRFSQWFTHQLPKWLVCLAVFFAIVALQFFAWNSLQGSWFSGPRAYMDQGSFSLVPRHALQVLFSSFHGLFHWHPILLIGAAALFLPADNPRIRRERTLCAVGFLATLWLVSSWSCWWAGASFGHRMFISTYPMLAYGFCMASHQFLQTDKSPRQRLLILAMIVLFACAWNGAILRQYATTVPREAPVSILDFVCNMFP